MKKGLCVIVGFGPGNGAAFCRRFLKEGYQVAILARNLDYLEDYAANLNDVFPFRCDVCEADGIKPVFARIQDELGVPDVVIYNAGSGVWGSAMEITVDDFEMAWRINALGLLCVAKEIAPVMIENGGGSLLVTGATASLRGGANFAAFASAKAAQRNLTQSLARSLGKQGLHVVLVIIDGIIDMPRTREMLPDKPDSLFMQPDSIAEAYYHLSRQERSAWTFELDLRPAEETW